MKNLNIIIITVIVGHILAVQSATQEYQLPNRNHWHVDESWLVYVKEYRWGDWMIAASKGRRYEEKPIQQENLNNSFTVKISVAGEETVNGKECWILSYIINKNQVKDNEYRKAIDEFCIKNLAWITKDTGNVVQTTNPMPQTIGIHSPSMFDNIRYIDNNSTLHLPIQAIPWERQYDKNGKEKHCTTVHYSENKSIFRIELSRPSMRDNYDDKCVQVWNENNNLWSRYEYYLYGDKCLTADLLKHIPADGYCEWKDTNNRQMTVAKLVSIDKVNVTLKQKKDNKEMIVPIKNLCESDKQHVDFELFLLEEQNKKQPIKGTLIENSVKMTMPQVENNHKQKLNGHSVHAVEKKYPKPREQTEIENPEVKANKNTTQDNKVHPENVLGLFPFYIIGGFAVFVLLVVVFYLQRKSRK